MGKLSPRTISIFEKARESFRLAAKAIREGQQWKGLEGLVIDMEHLVVAIESAFMEVKQELNQLESKLDKQEGKLDRQEGKLDRLEGKLDRLESKLDGLGNTAGKLEEKLDRGVNLVPGVTIPGTVTVNTGTTVPVTFTASKRKTG